jgi:hypothetical protein
MGGSAILARIVEVRILLVRKVEEVMRHDELPCEPLQLLCGRHCMKRPNSRYDQSLEF